MSADIFAKIQENRGPLGFAERSMDILHFRNLKVK